MLCLNHPSSDAEKHIRNGEEDYQNAYIVLTCISLMMVLRIPTSALN